MKLARVIKNDHPHLYHALKPIWSIVMGIKKIPYQRKWGEIRISNGDQNPEKIFYVIRRDDGKVGMFSYMLLFLEHIRYALDNGYIPVIDMKNYPNPYVETIGKENAWEFYFEQPLRKDEGGLYSLKDVEKSKNVILSNGGEPSRPAFDSIDMTAKILSSKEYSTWSRICQKYIRFNKETLEYAQKEYNKILDPKERVIAVSLRGTDYSNAMPSGHPIQPEVEAAIEVCEKYLDDWNCSKLFLATEDMEIVKKMLSHFGNKVVTTDRKLYKYVKSMAVTQEGFERENDHYLRGLEYITQMIILTKCNCLIAGVTSGITGTVLLHDRFEHIYLFDLGIY